jgi:hypothetical protein
MFDDITVAEKKPQWIRGHDRPVERLPGMPAAPTTMLDWFARCMS